MKECAELIVAHTVFLLCEHIQKQARFRWTRENRERGKRERWKKGGIFISGQL